MFSSAKTIGAYLFVLLICCLAAYWPLSLHVFSLKNDALNYFLPVRYQISEAISSGYWPFWSPYFNLGYPLHGDMQSGVWNPFIQIISLFGPYTLKTLENETLLYIYLSGVGMFFLVKHLFQNCNIALLAGAGFMLCGFNSDSAQFLNWISAASFLPFVFLFYYRTLVEKNWKTAICTAFFLYLLFTTAYPADFILTSYLLFFILARHLYQRDNRKRKMLRQVLHLHGLIVILFLLLSLPALISYVQFLPVTERGMGASYREVMSNSLHPSLLFSYLAPLPVWKADFAWITDPLERNSYFGLIPFSLLLLSYFSRSNRRLISFLKWGFIISVLFSFGEWGGLRVVSYYALPFMNTFRHPANAKLFSIFFGCLLAAFALQQVISGQVHQKLKNYVWRLLLFFFIGLTAWSLAGNLSFFNFVFTDNGATGLKLFLDQLGFSDLLLLNIVLQIPFLLILYYAFVKQVNFKILLTASLLNCIIHTALFQPFTVVKKDSVAFVQKILYKEQVRGYPPPDLQQSPAENSVAGLDYFKEIGVSNMYNKKIGRVDYRITPSNLLTQNKFWFNEKMRTILLHYPLFYRADTATIYADSIASEPNIKKWAVVKSKADMDFINQSDASIHSTSVKKFTPSGWDLEVQNDRPGYYCLFQNYYPRWQLFIDGKEKTLDCCNISFMGFRLPEGKHIISFQYRATDLKIASGMSMITMLIMLFLILFKRSKIQ